jgi:hypothetical protein
MSRVSKTPFLLGSSYMAVLGLEALGWALAKLTVAWTKTAYGGVGECSKVIREPWLPLHKAAPFLAGEIEICGQGNLPCKDKRECDG